jgi:hypothetical protein
MALSMAQNLQLGEVSRNPKDEPALRRTITSNRIDGT